MLKRFQTPNQDLNFLQSAWGASLDPLLDNPSNKRLRLAGVSLANGTTVINHKLGRKLQGWNTIRVRAAATIYDAQDSNQTPELTLVLISNAAVTVDLEVF